ncbi:carboxymethylenebutenolidase homolog isoform 1-T2 [Amazona ochrocephala]
MIKAGTLRNSYLEKPGPCIHPFRFLGKRCLPGSRVALTTTLSSCDLPLLSRTLAVLQFGVLWYSQLDSFCSLVSHMANESRPCPCDIGDKFDYGGCGEEVQVEHIKAYVCKPPASTDKAVIVIHDIFGWELPNTRYIADMLATNGYIATCPDFFVGQEAWKLSNDWATFDDWLKTRSAGKIDKEVDVILKYLKEQCGAKKIGVVGFCWGGAAVQHLMLKNPHLQAGVSLYGVIKFFADMSSFLHPTFFIFGEKDELIPLQQIAALEQKLKQNCKVDYEVKIYPGQTHGFVHRKREDINPQDKPYIEEGRKDMINWLNKYL